MKTIIKLLTLLSVLSALLQADLKTDLRNISTSMIDLNTSIATVTISSDAMCALLIALNQQTKALLDQIKLGNNNITSPLVLDDETLNLTQDLYINLTAVSSQSLALSNTISLLQPTTDALTLSDGITAMLQLSSDIGEMANRIGEMADNILIMADNIGLMADRIVQTQVIQSENLALTQNSILTTQTNTLALVSVVETASYDLNLNTLLLDGDALVAKLSLVSLNSFNMASELSDAQADINAYFVQVKQFQEIINADGASNMMYINSDSLNALVNLSIIMQSIGTVMDGYGVMIESAQLFTSDSTLDASMQSILKMSADIGQMSNAILEMADLILVMSDNIGLQADQILLTQELQNSNIAATQASILSSQTLALNIISAIN